MKKIKLEYLDQRHEVFKTVVINSGDLLLTSRELATYPVRITVVETNPRKRKNADVYVSDQLTLFESEMQQPLVTRMEPI